MKKRSVLSIVLITLILFLVVGVLGAEKCFDDGDGGKICEEDIPNLAQNFDDFKNLPPSLRSYIFDNDKFLDNFKEASAEEQAKFFYGKNDESEFILTADQLTKLTQNSEPEKFSQTLNQFANKFFEDSYDAFPSGKKPGIKTVEIDDTKTLSWVDSDGGRRLTNNKKGSINFGEGPDKISSLATKIRYTNGNLAVTYGENIELEYETGTPATNGGFFDSEGNLVGGDKSLNFLYETPNQLLNKKFSVSFVEEDGKKYTEIKISGEENSIGLRAIDINGNDYFIGANKDNKAYKGNFPAIIRIDENGVMEVKSTHIKTSFFEDKTSNNDFTTLIGDFFNKPGQGVVGLQERLMESLGPKLKDKVLSKAKEIFGQGFEKGIIKNPQTLPEDYAKFREESINEVLKENPNMNQALAEKLFDSSSSITQGLVKSKSTMQGIASGTGELLGKALIDLGIYNDVGLVGFLEGKGSLVGPSVQEGLQESLKEISNPSYKSYEEAGKSFLFVQESRDDITGKNIIDMRAGGKYQSIDISKGNKEINSFIANNYGHETVNGKSNGEAIYLNNGGFLVGFRGSEMTDSRGKKVEANLHPAFYNKARVSVNQIQNAFTENEDYYVLSKTSSGTKFFRSDSRISFQSSANTYLVGDRMGVRGVVVKAGGIELKNIPQDKNQYPLPDDAKMDFIIDPQAISYGERRFGMRIRRVATTKIAIPQITESATKSMRDIANMFDDEVIGTISTMIQKEYNGDPDLFFNKMNVANSLINSGQGTDYIDSSIRNMFPGHEPQEVKDTLNLVSGNAYSSTMTNLANHQGIVNSNNRAGLSNQGFDYNGQLISGDKGVARYLFSNAVRNSPEDTYQTFSQAESEAGQTAEKRNYNIKTRIYQRFSGTTPQTSQSQPTTPKKYCYTCSSCGRTHCRSVY